MKRVFLIFREDITYYPPIYSVIKILQELKFKVVVIGEYTDQPQKEKLISEGVDFWLPFFYTGEGNLFSRWLSIRKWKSQIEKYLEKQSLSRNDFVWIFQAETIAIFNKLPDKYNVIAHPLEFNNPGINWKFKLNFPFLKLDKLFSRVYDVICCEYNRAQIFKGMYGLEKLPTVLPNKPYLSDLSFLEKNSLESDAKFSTVFELIKNKKIILYQGVFQNKERRLEEFCEAMNLLSDEFILIAMGKGSELFENLKAKYESEKIIFIPFVAPPLHLLITKLAFIGVLSYFPRKGSFASIINPLYCAPNKIFEYSMFGIPMISNDIPGLKYIFKEFHCGECVDYPMTPENIRDAIVKVSNNYQDYSKGSLEYYNSVDMKKIVKGIIDN